MYKVAKRKGQWEAAMKNMDAYKVLYDLSKLWLTMRNLIGSWTNINWRNIKVIVLSVPKHWFLV
jgi:hypothetical protein